MVKQISFYCHIRNNCLRGDYTTLAFTQHTSVAEFHDGCGILGGDFLHILGFVVFIASRSQQRMTTINKPSGYSGFTSPFFACPPFLPCHNTVSVFLPAPSFLRHGMFVRTRLVC